MKMCCGAIILVLTVAVAIAENALTPKILDKMDGFTVIGIKVRTDNAKEMTGDGLIGKQWQRFFEEGVADKIPNKADTSFVAVYTDYASDHNGEYTFVVGAKVTSDTQVPEGMVAVKIPAGSYAVFTSEKGPVQEIAAKTWTRIWALPKSEAGGDRAYKADFEVYDQRAMDPQNAQVDVYVGIK
jgi:predicted transcriptional regulator YdeE